MIKFFRRLRRRLLSENKLSRYLIYAIGEIVLVVIGILLALQINNWNEIRKQKNTINDVLLIIQSDLAADISVIDKVIDEMAPLDTLYEKVVNKEMTSDFFKNCELCPAMLAGYPDISLRKTGYDLLKTHSTTINAHVDSLSTMIADFYSLYNIEIDVANREIKRDFADNYSFFKNNKSWFIDYIDGVENDEYISYVVSSSDYRNRAKSFHLLYHGIYLSLLQAYKLEASKIIDDIEKEIK